MEGYPEQESIETLLLCPAEVVETGGRVSSQDNQAYDADAVGEILNSLTYNNLRHDIRVDSRIKTELFAHQKEAVDFISKRETGTFPSKLSLWKYNSTDADDTW
ncbi:hypothetical protein J7337_001842 [Fusarium musae]|uniref:Uncharacterized protein n=1 Tax=Fusarium musae TaxID=1042133 RepID=A0A9P8DUJ3_9HYPO|nr:hypothetical protein J7337_001842 [Fusarium musae]KAG9508278.1 hypothetical protein J7337_001842 [Fusarium musae]